ncbi:MAG: hypothetical protein U9R50_01430 [Campylobacterota bacterium]|nr:hypothetical protein [Campylobacterota bacterium]
MTYKKLLPLLLMVTLWINYENYIKVDEKKIKNKIALIKNRIARENKITNTFNSTSFNKTLKEKNPYLGMMYDANLSYSKAMGLFQNEVYDALDSRCKIENLTWASSSKTQHWYERLRLEIRMECSPKGFTAFKNALHATGKIYKFENFRVIRNDKSKKLRLLYQLIGYKLRVNDA